MLRILVVPVLLGVCSMTAAQGLSLAEVKARGGMQLNADDLKQLMPDAKVVSPLRTGGTRRWTNESTGRFVASTDGRSISGGHPVPISGQGTWRIADNGTYCVKIVWITLTEDWCAYMFKAGDKYYGVRNLEDNAPAGEFEISR